MIKKIILDIIIKKFLGENRLIDIGVSGLPYIYYNNRAPGGAVFEM